MTTSEQCTGAVASLGREIPSLLGACEREGVREAMFFIWEHKPKLSHLPSGEGLVLGHWVRGEVETK